jgi:hypothetical protein
MVALEAWALGKPVLANAKCDVLKGQSIRSNAGLYYEGEAEFVEALSALEQNRWLSASLGRNGREFFREHYDWAVIERKYLGILERLTKTPEPRSIAPLPGWFARRKATLPPGGDVVKSLPSGPSLRTEPGAPRPAVSTPPPPPPRHHDRGFHASQRGSRRPRRGGPPRRPGSAGGR